MQQGSAYVGPKFSIDNVLFIPALKCNLISLVQLYDDVDIFITIYRGVCVIQDHTLKMPIGVGE